MRIRQLPLFAVWLATGWAQTGPVDTLSLKDSVRLALSNNRTIVAAAAAESAAGDRTSQSRAALRPNINYAESWTRSDNPVFVFSSLLTQHQFGAENFQIGPLNRPDFMNDFQSAISGEQTLYDGGRARYAIRSAEIAREMAGENRRLTGMEVAVAAVRAYYDVVLSARLAETAQQAIRSAEADLERAQAFRAAGMSTDADVLSIKVHRAGVEEERIRREADLDVARATLNDILGLPLDAPHTLSTPLERLAVLPGAVSSSEASAATERPEVREAGLALRLAENQAAEARAAWQPQVVLHGAFEADRQRFYDRGGANWTVALGLRWNLFNGLADKAKQAEAASLLHRSQAEQAKANSGVRLEVRRAWAGLTAAEQRITVAEAAVAEATESLRITQNRYEAGLANITELLRTETALLAARTRHLAAIHDQRVAAAMVEFTAGKLTADSEVLN